VRRDLYYKMPKRAADSIVYEVRADLQTEDREADRPNNSTQRAGASG
jgi:hypothetical protein